MSGGDKSFTYGETPSLSATAYEGQSIDWYDADGNLVSNASNTIETTNLTTKVVTSSFTPSVAVAKSYTFYAQARGSCATTVRTPIKLTINKILLTVTVVDKSQLNKVYDGKVTVPLLVSNMSVGGVLARDANIEFLDPNVSPTATFADKIVNPNKIVTVTGYKLTEAAAVNYDIPLSIQVPGIAISSLGITGKFTADDKTHDGKTDAVILTRELVGTIPGDLVSLIGGVAHFEDPHSSEELKRVIFDMTNASLTGADAGNYSLTSVADAFAKINKVLPVTLVDFEGKQRNASVYLYWRTASEKDNDYFQVERSQDGKAFIAIGQVKGNGTTNVVQNYSFTDGVAPAGTVYYRLKQVDYDGKFEYSKVIAVKADGRSGAEATLVAKPNPTPGKVVFTSTDAASGPVTLILYHSSGRVVVQKQVEQGQELSLDLAGQVPGIYYVQVQTTTGKTTTRVVKQ